MRMYYMVTIISREYGDRFVQFFSENGIRTLSAALCDGTAQKRTLDLLGIEKTEKLLLSAVMPGSTVPRILRGLVRTMDINSPGGGICFTVPLRSAGSACLQYLTQGQTLEQNEVTNMEENRFSLVVAIARKGHAEQVMDAARSAGAGGGTIIHAKGVGNVKESYFFGVSIAEEQELLYIVTRQEDEKTTMRSIMEKAGPKQGHAVAVFSLPVHHVAGLRSLTDGD